MSGTTSRLGLPYPEGTDLVKDGDDVMQAAAELLDNPPILLPRRAAGGSGQFPASGTASSNLAITYPAGRFPTAPQTVLVTLNHNTSTAIAAGIGGQSATGFTAIAVTNTGTGSIGICNMLWLAILY